MSTRHRTVPDPPQHPGLGRGPCQHQRLIPGSPLRPKPQHKPHSLTEASELRYKDVLDATQVSKSLQAKNS